MQYLDPISFGDSKISQSNPDTCVPPTLSSLIGYLFVYIPNNWSYYIVPTKKWFYKKDVRPDTKPTS